MSYDESKAKDLFFIIDGSRSMNDKVKASGMRRMDIVRVGLLGFVNERWAVSYVPWPLRIGITFYRLLGTPGSTQLDVVVPLNPAPASLELYRLNEMPCKGGSPLVDAIRFSLGEIADSLRGEKRVKLISDGGNDGEPVKNCAEELKAAKVAFDAIELSNSASQELRGIATLTGGRYYRPNGLAEFNAAIRE
ncbi:MAG: VWA domain-containing protein [Nitrososphaerales archaeon]|nr:VWA domain-containing protein [Nitrososphaerales archaeon]